MAVTKIERTNFGIFNLRPMNIATFVSGYKFRAIILETMILLDSDGHSGFLQEIFQADHALFSRINQQWTNILFDNLFPYMRESEIWVPFYLFLLVFITINFVKKGWLWAFFLIMTAVIGDLISSHLMKTLVFRLRPCQDPAMASTIRVLAAYCPSSSSFTSSHACNHFALAIFIFSTLRHTSPWWSLVFVWAFFISYAQIYVGVHYPIDVFCGAILGCLIGYGTSQVFRKQFGMLTLQSYNHIHG
jgi:membrane-associated phospholipid phosphatase